MIIYLGNTFTSYAEGKTWRRVVCEFCKNEYVYLHHVKVKHSEFSAVGADDNGALERLPEALRLRLEYQLKNSAGRVACPECGCLQRDMCDEYRRRNFGWLAIVSFVGGCGIPLGIIPIAEVYGYDNSKRPNSHEFYSLILIAWIFLSAVTILVFVSYVLLMKFCNPNSVRRVLRRQAFPDSHAMSYQEFKKKYPNATATRRLRRKS